MVDASVPSRRLAFGVKDIFPPIFVRIDASNVLLELFPYPLSDALRFRNVFNPAMTCLTAGCRLFRLAISMLKVSVVNLSVIWSYAAVCIGS